MNSFQSRAQGCRNPNPGLPDLQPQASDEILGKVENALAGSDIPPEVRAQLMNFMASNQRAKRSQASISQPAWQQQPLASAGGMLNGSMLNGSMGFGPMPASLGLTQQQFPGASSAAWGEGTPFNNTQPSAMLGQSQALGCSSKPQSSLPAAHAAHAFTDLPGMNPQMGQNFQGMPGASKPVQQQPNLHGALPHTQPLQHTDDHLAMQNAQDRLLRNPVQSLQSQPQHISHRPALTANLAGILPSSHAAQQGLHASTAGLTGVPPAANVSQAGSLMDPWDLPDLAALQGNHQTGINDLHLDPIGSLGSYNGQPADQPPHQSAPPMPRPYDSVPLPGPASLSCPALGALWPSSCACNVYMQCVYALFASCTIPFATLWSLHWLNSSTMLPHCVCIICC